MDTQPTDNQKRIGQWDIIPGAVKQRACEAWLTFSGLEADIPSGSSEVKMYYATDTNKLYLWDGSAWENITVADPTPPVIPTVKQIIIGSSGGVQIAQGSTRYIGTYVKTDSYIMPISIPGTIRNLQVYSQSGPVIAGETFTCTMMNDNSATALTCIITTGNNHATDSTHSFTVTAGQRISLRVVASAASTDELIEWSVEFDPS